MTTLNDFADEMMFSEDKALRSLWFVSFLQQMRWKWPNRPDERMFRYHQI